MAKTTKAEPPDEPKRTSRPRKSRAKDPADRKRSGRPTTIHSEIAPDVKNTKLFIDAIRAGCTFETAAAGAGGSLKTYNYWRRVGAACRTEIHNTIRTADSLTPYEQACLEFSVAVEKADGEWEVEQNARLDQHARGGLTKTITTTKTLPNGNVETTVRVETLPSDPNVIIWRLQHRHPERYYPKLRTEITGAEGKPIEISFADRAAAVLDELTGFMNDE